MQNLDAALQNYVEPTGHKMEGLMLTHPFTVKYSNNDEHFHAMEHLLPALDLKNICKNHCSTDSSSQQ